MTEPEQIPEYESIRPLHDKMLLQFLSDEYVTPSGIVVNVANIEEEKCRRARVVSVGPGRVAQSTGLGRGDIVFLSRHRAHELPTPANMQQYVMVDANWGVKEWIGAQEVKEIGP